MSKDIKETIEELEQMEREAAPAPWGFAHCVNHADLDRTTLVEKEICFGLRDANRERVTTDKFIAGMRNALPALLAELAELRKERDELRKERDELRKETGP